MRAAGDGGGARRFRSGKGGGWEPGGTDGAGRAARGGRVGQQGRRSRKRRRRRRRRRLADRLAQHPRRAVGGAGIDVLGVDDPCVGERQVGLHHQLVLAQRPRLEGRVGVGEEGDVRVGLEDRVAELGGEPREDVLPNVVEVEAHVPPLGHQHAVVLRLARVHPRAPDARERRHREAKALTRRAAVAHVQDVREAQ